MFYNKNMVIFIAQTLALLVIGCQKNPVDGDTDCPPLRPNIALSSYGSPVWHPEGKIIAFNNTPLKRIYRDSVDCLYYYEFYDDSAGFWIINGDGTNKQWVLPYGLGEPDWSPDGKWIVFEQGTQIYKMRFANNEFDTTSLTQLTFEGRNFFPAWSPDGQWIAYDNTNCGSAIEPPPPNSCGVLMVESSVLEIKFVFKGRMPDWSPDGEYLIYVGLHSEIYRVNVNDTTEIVRLTSLNQADTYAMDNRNPRYSPDGSKIAFLSQRGNGELVQIWLMNADGTNITQLTTKGVGTMFNWSPDGKEIVYVSYRFTDYSFTNGTLWILNLETEDKQQLTFNNSSAPVYNELPLKEGEAVKINNEIISLFN